MGIINEIMELKRGIKNNETMLNHYKNAMTTYDVEKYQKEFFYYMERIYPFRHSVNIVLLENAIKVEIKNIETVPNYPCKSNWTLSNFLMIFYSDNEELMRVTIDPFTDLEKRGSEGRVTDVIGVNSINITRCTIDEDKFLLAVESFKYVMKNPEEILQILKKKTEDDYRCIINDSYYNNLDEIQRINDFEIMLKQYMNNPLTYIPFESKKVERPNFSKMELDELITEFNKKSNSDDVDKACTALGETIMGFVPDMKSKSEEITEFYNTVSDNENYISDDCTLNLEREATVNNNGFTYHFKTYSRSSQMLIDILKDGKNVGSLYYWNNKKGQRDPLYFYTQDMGAGRPIDFRGFNEKTIPIFMDALLNMDKNWNQIVTFVLTIFMKDVQAVLDDYKKQSEEMFQAKEKEMENYYKRQEEFTKYF